MERRLGKVPIRKEEASRLANEEQVEDDERRHLRGRKLR